MLQVQVTALQFGPLGTDGTSFSVLVREVEVLTPVSTVERAIIRFPMPKDVDVEVQSAMGFDIPISNTPILVTLDVKSNCTGIVAKMLLLIFIV